MEKCKKCGSERWTIKSSGPHYGAYCRDCGGFIKWLKKAEAEKILESAAVEKDKLDKGPCSYCCEDDYVIVRAYGEGGICAWENITANFCPVCGRERRTGGDG